MVTVIICTRNRPELFMRALRSVLNQTFKDFEIIVIDDASDMKYPVVPVRYFRNDTRKGLAYNRNFGADKARGEYIVSLDDDNEFHKRFLEKTVAYLDAHPEFSAVGVGRNVVYPEGTVYQHPTTPCSINDGNLMRKAVYQKLRCDEFLTANEDSDLGIRFFKHFKMGLIDWPLMTVQGSPIFNTTSYSDYTDFHLAGLVRFWLKNKDEFNEADAKYQKRYLGRMFLLASGQMKWFRWGYWLQEKVKRYYQISENF